MGSVAAASTTCQSIWPSLNSRRTCSQPSSTQTTYRPSGPQRRPGMRTDVRQPSPEGRTLIGSVRRLGAQKQDSNIQCPLDSHARLPGSGLSRECIPGIIHGRMIQDNGLI